MISNNRLFNYNLKLFWCLTNSCTPWCTTVSASPSAVAKTPDAELSFNAALLVNAKVYIIADKYDLQDLKALAKNKYEEVVPENWNSTTFVASLKLLYEDILESDRLLKYVAVETAGEHAKELVDRGEFVALCSEHGELAFDVLKSSLKHPKVVKCAPLTIVLTNQDIFSRPQVGATTTERRSG